MTEVLASRSFRGPAAEDAIEAVHNDLDSLWLDVPFVNDLDQMTFTTAVIESASNIVQHAQPAGDREVERRVIELVAQGLTNPQIARRTGVSERTVVTDVRRICRRVGVRSRSELAVLAGRKGGVPVE